VSILHGIIIGVQCIAAVLLIFRHWVVDACLCFGAAVVVTPADPYSVFRAFPFVFAFWMILRFIIAKRLTRSANSSVV
jgi:hypothetical protein